MVSLLSLSVGPRAKAATVAAFAMVLPCSLQAQDPAQAAPPEVVIESVRVEGNVRQPASVIEAEAGIRSGDRLAGPAAYRAIQRAIHRLWETGQFSDVQVLAEPVSPDSPERLALIIRVEEQPYVGAIEFEGLESLRPSTVRDTAGLRSGAPFQPERVAAAEHAVRSMLAEKGIRVRDVGHRLEEIPGREGEYRLVFQVTEGQRVAISDIVFEGNRVFSDSRLRGVMDTKPEGFWWFRPGTYDEERIRVDLRSILPGFYGSNGYIDFVVAGDSLVVDPESGKARLIISVEEGIQYQLAGIDIQGNTRFPSEELTRFFEREQGGILSSVGLGRSQMRETGEIFDQTAFARATEQIQQVYRNRGYLYAQVEPIIERTKTASGAPAVEVGWRIREGEPAYVNRVMIAGNTHTHEDVIRERILVLPGDVYTDDAVAQSWQNIAGLGFFETPLPPPNIVPTETGDVDITFEVTEKQTGSLNFGTAIGGYSRLSGFLGYDEPNLFGQAKSGHLRWEFGRYSNNFEASYSDPGILGSRISGSASLFNSRNRYIYFEEGQFRRMGGSLRFGVPVPGDRWTRAFLGYSLTRTTYKQSSQPSSVFSLPAGMQSTASLGLTRSTMNHPLFPTAGTRQEVQAELSGGPLGGDGDFQKYTAGGSWYVPLGQVGGGQPGQRPVRFTLGITAEAGALFGDASRFPFERFWMGGVQFGRPLRGYDENTITPLGYFRRGSRTGVDLEDRFGDAFLRMSAEYAVRLNDNFSVSAFYDAGNLWRDPMDMNPTKLFRGAGLGVMLITPFGPIGLDYAYGFDKDQPGWQLHFKMGQLF